MTSTQLISAVQTVTSVKQMSSGGLVQRSTGTSEASGWGHPGSEKDLDVPDVDEGYEDKTEDSKTVRLTLMEEVLLLGIKDREVSTSNGSGCGCCF